MGPVRRLPDHLEQLRQQKQPPPAVKPAEQAPKPPKPAFDPRTPAEKVDDYAGFT